ncbi:hypothetical protein LTR59_015277 [Friedmanniomyces endolithicus]|nr:hypothetical protein LTR94_018332 [Friedmanniomyces endolithicus]KAK0770810.1 hypothetical protein LTR38_017444 [Friedmanniomyces endolithicus]KAK0773452.1 hypothetical protein LTR59_015277 [Friedmanniomyces endolithicus]
MAEESSLTLPARPVFIKNKRSSQALRTGVAMPTYTIQQDAPWMTSRTSSAPTESSTHSEDYEQVSPGSDTHRPPQPNNKSSYHPSYHAHPQQQIVDNGPQVRQSRLPIFKQVRSMLQKPPPLITPENTKWDDFSGELSETGKPPQVKPSAYVSPYERFRRRSPERRGMNRLTKASPVSMLLDEEEEVKPPPPLNITRMRPRSIARSPVSPISPVSPVDYGPLTSGSNSERTLAPALVTTPSVMTIKRKPTPSSAAKVENLTPQRSPSITSNWIEPPDEEEPPSGPAQQSSSHFSWTTYATSVALGVRRSIDSSSTRHTKQPSTQDQAPHKSHFSWSTVNTAMTYQNRAPDSPPPSPPPPIPAKYATAWVRDSQVTPGSDAVRDDAQHPASLRPGTVPSLPAKNTTFEPPPASSTYKPYSPAQQTASPASLTPETYKPRGLPVQSILSRQRPVQRMDNQEWTPPPRKSSVTPTHRSATSTPSSAVHPAPRSVSPLPSTSQQHLTNENTQSSSSKALPPPPSLTTATSGSSSPISHLDHLLAREKDLQHQRSNTARAIADLEKTLKASPLEVGWRVHKETEKAVEGHRSRMEEISLEEREVGIKISRVRRKEGEEEGLWVRRVTG